MEPRFGHDFGEARVHAGPRAAQAAKSVNAVTYTVGRDIVVGRENVAPDTRQGRELIAHERAHVVQQSRRTPSEPSNLRSTRPDDAAGRTRREPRQRRRCALPVRPQTRTGVALARQMDGGAPAAAPVLAPRDAGSVTVDVEGSGGANGTATVTVGATPAGSESVTIRGGIQTTPGNAGNMRLRAIVGTAVMGQPPGFTVAAFPINWTDTFAADVNEPHLLGVTVRDGWSCDGSGSVSELDQVEIAERVDVQSRDNSPFTSVGATSASGTGTSGFLPGNSLTGDTHTYRKANINTAGLGFGSWSLVYGQLSLFNCKRTGVTNAIMPASGMTTTHTVWNFAPAPGWKYQTVKVGAHRRGPGGAAGRELGA
jgi:hypothetical protein